MKKIIRVLCHQLLETHVVLILISSVRTVPIANRSALNSDLLANVNDGTKQIKPELQRNEKSADAEIENLQVVDQLIADDADGLPSSGSGLTATSATIEDLVHAQLNNGRFMLEDITQMSKETDKKVDKVDAETIQVRQRLQKLDFYFELLRVMSEDCRQRMLCEVTRDAERFYPLSSVFEEVTSFAGSYQYLTSQLVNTTDGARLLSYLEASFRGQERTRTCAVFQYRCPSRTEEMINYDALCLWREMVHWLTVHVVAKVH